MVIKIDTTKPLVNNYIYKNISYKKSVSDYNTVAQNINICSDSINSPVKSMSGDISILRSSVYRPVTNMSGDIKIDSCTIERSVSNMSGHIDIFHSKIYGNIENQNGNIRICLGSKVKGNISNMQGSVTLSESSISGDVRTNGKIFIYDSKIDGTVTAKPENLEIKGQNSRIENLTLVGYKKANDKNHYVLNEQGEKVAVRKQIVIKNGKVFYGLFDKTSEKPIEFKLTKGTEIHTIEFDSDIPGILILEPDLKFNGKVINGIVKRRNNDGTYTVISEKINKSKKQKQPNSTSQKSKSPSNPENNVPEINSLDDKKLESVENEQSQKLLKQSEIDDDIYEKEEQKPLAQLNYIDTKIETDATDLPSKKYQYSSTFRDEELFDPETDELTSPRYLQYSVDDVALRDDLFMNCSQPVSHYNQNHTYFYPETSPRTRMGVHEDLQLPWVNKDTDEEQVDVDDLGVFMNLAKEQIGKINNDYYLPNKIFRNCTILKNGKYEYDINLCKLALKLFKSSEEWGETEEQIIKEIKIPIYGKTYGAISSFKYDMADRIVYAYSNKVLLRQLKKASPLDVYGIRDLE